VNDKVRNDPAGRLGEEVRLTMAMDHALTKAMHEIEELHRHYDEQERVIKDHDDLIVELMAEEDSEDDSDSNFGPDYAGDDDRGAEDDTEEDPKEVPEGDAPQEHVPQLEPPIGEVPLEEAPHQVVKPQTVLAPAPSGLPRLYMQLM
jgi:hypothetical protein